MNTCKLCGEPVLPPPTTYAGIAGTTSRTKSTTGVSTPLVLTSERTNDHVIDRSH